MTTPTITLYPDTLPAKGQANDAFDVNVNSFLNWLTLTNGPELQGLVTYTNDVANTVLATALAGDLPPLTGKAGNYIRANAAENGGEFRTPAQVKADIGLSGITDNSTATAITINSGNNVLVSCTSVPSASVNGLAVLSSGILVASVGADKVAVFNRNTNDGEIVLLQNGGGNIGFLGVSGGNLTIGAGASGNEHMRITSNGAVFIGSGGIGDDLNSFGFSPVDKFSQVAHITGTAGGTLFTRFRYGSTDVGSITQNGTTAVSYNTTSDYRLKENITPIVGAADIVKSMRPATYTFKADGTWHDGFLAHELQELHPRAVTGFKDAMKDEEYEITPAVEAIFDAEGVELTSAEPAVMGTRSVPDFQGVDYSKLTPILTAALQEALAKIDDLTARIDALEGAA